MINKEDRHGIFRLKILHRQFHLILTVLVRKKHKKWVKMEKFTPLAKILHWWHWQIPTLLETLQNLLKLLFRRQEPGVFCVHALCQLWTVLFMKLFSANAFLWYFVKHRATSKFYLCLIQLDHKSCWALSQKKEVRITMLHTVKWHYWNMHRNTGTEMRTNYKKNIVTIHSREKGWIGKYAPWGNLEGRGVQIAEGGVFSNSSRLEAVYCHSFFQSGSVLEITL